MKKLLSLCVIIMLFASTSLCYGQETFEEGIEPKYVGTFYHIESFADNSGATLIAEAILKPKEENSFDKVVINIQIKKVTTGKEYLNKNFTTYYDTLRNRFYAKTSFTAPLKGTYRMNTIYKCYKSGKLIETINGEPRVATY